LLSVDVLSGDAAAKGELSHEPPRIDVFPKIKWNTALDFGLLHIDISPCVVIE
jgi:hypothetical protein